MEDASNILAIVAAARRIAQKYPNATPEVQTINNAVQQLQMKIMTVQPPAQPAAPPQ
jgi:outer membrane murein-binding lipoprotein Lpp